MLLTDVTAFTVAVVWSTKASEGTAFGRRAAIYMNGLKPVCTRRTTLMGLGGLSLPSYEVNSGRDGYGLAQSIRHDCGVT